MRSWYRPLVFIGIALVAFIGTHQVQRAVDPVRRARAVDTQYTYLPSPETTHVASLGYHIMVADLMWIRAVLQFVDIIDSGGQQGLRWLHTMLDTVIRLDPRWRTTYFYGGSMLRVLKDVEGSDRIFSAGMAALPEDHHFPFSLAMNAYLYRDDPLTAVKYLIQASECPNAPAWYTTAVGGFIHKSGQRRTAIRYLKEQIEASGSDRERTFLSNKYVSLVHDEIASTLEDRRKQWEAAQGRPLVDLSALGDLPPDPYKKDWIIANDGAIRSQHMDGVVARREKLSERSMLTHRWLRAK
jgi:hypothetical protein